VVVSNVFHASTALGQRWIMCVRSSIVGHLLQSGVSFMWCLYSRSLVKVFLCSARNCAVFSFGCNTLRLMVNGLGLMGSGPPCVWSLMMSRVQMSLTCLIRLVPRFSVLIHSFIHQLY